jgi:hypothetical protein
MVLSLDAYYNQTKPRRTPITMILICGVSQGHAAAAHQTLIWQISDLRRINVDVGLVPDYCRINVAIVGLVSDFARHGSFARTLSLTNTRVSGVKSMESMAAGPFIKLPLYGVLSNKQKRHNSEFETQQ